MFRYSIYSIIMIFCFTLNSLSQESVMKGISPDRIYYNGKIITVDKNFTIAQAVAIRGDKFLAVGKNEDILKMTGANTKKIDLEGRTVIPGLIDAHGHPDEAALSELFEEIPDVHDIKELLGWISNKANKKKPGEWVVHPKIFSTRIKEMRWPGKDQLDKAAPNNPVFLNGTYGGMVNSYALRISNINKDTEHEGVLKDKNTGKPTGFLRSSAFELLKGISEPELTYEQRLDAIVNMIKLYNSVGITGINIGWGGPSKIKIFQDIYEQKRLTARVLLNIHLWQLDVNPDDPVDEIRQKLSNLGFYTGFGNEWVRVGALKWHMDGGILTGTAYLREPWAKENPDRAEEVYGITDPDYRGVLLVTKEQLVPVVKIANEIGWKFTCHSTGGGGVDVILDAFEEVNKINPIEERRFSIIHGNFYTPESIKRMKRLGVYADSQPAWFYKDSEVMRYILGEQKIKSFHPYKSLFNEGVIVNGGSDHMVQFNPNTSTNPYNPFLSMWTVITRKTERGNIINIEQAISREEALKMYTINNAYASFEENIKGSIEAGKLADMVILTEDLLTCPVNNIKNIKVETTLVGGKVVFER